MDNFGDYISRDDGKVAAWEILEGMGYSIKYNDRMAEEVDAVFDEIPTADVRPKWISVDDALPELHDAEYLDEVTGEVIHYKESEPILIWLAKGGFMDIGIYEKSDSVDDFCYQGVPHTVTYWTLLPSAPEEKADA